LRTQSVGVVKHHIEKRAIIFVKILNNSFLDCLISFTNHEVALVHQNLRLVQLQAG
jgi:hypothetical protein